MTNNIIIEIKPNFILASTIINSQLVTKKYIEYTKTQARIEFKKYLSGLARGQRLNMLLNN